MNDIRSAPPLKGQRPLVIHVISSLDFGGVERHMEIIASVLDHAQFRHAFVALGGGGAVESLLRDLGPEVTCLGQKVQIPSVGAFTSFLHHVLRERPMVVHTHGAEANFHGLLVAWIARVPVRIGEEIGIPGHSALARRTFGVVYRSASRVIGISQSVSDWLRTSGEVPEDRAIRIYNPVRLPTWTDPGPIDSTVFRVGFVGRLERVKNPLALLDAFSTFADSGVNWELWFIGDGGERAELERRIQQRNWTGKARLWGYQPNPASFVRQCHVYVQPSLSEGFGLALVEAMGCGVPVIATSVGGAPEIIEDGETGWLLPQATPDLIASALRHAWQLGPKKLREIGVRARRSVEDRFDPITYLGQIEALYRQLAPDSNVSHP